MTATTSGAIAGRTGALPVLRKRMPETRQAVTQKNAVGNTEFYVIVGFYEDCPFCPGEVFIHVAKEGSTLGGMCNALAVTISLALQFGVPWEALSVNYKLMRFDPNGQSLRGDQTYPSLAHAIADTIDSIIHRRRSEWGEKAPDITVVPPPPSPEEPPTLGAPVPAPKTPPTLGGAAERYNALIIEELAKAGWAVGAAFGIARFKSTAAKLSQESGEAEPMVSIIERMRLETPGHFRPAGTEVKTQ